VPARLRARILEGVHAGILQIQAPAGCGKTSVLLQVLDDEGIDPHWYTCTDDDSDPAHLIAGLTEAIGLSHTDAAQTAVAALASTDIQRSFRAALRPIVDELREHRDEMTILVLDDLDALLESPVALGLLHDLLTMIDDTMIVVLVSRAELSMLALAKRILDGRAVRVTADELLMQKDDIVAFAQAYGIDLPPEDVEHLYGATAGWAIALRLALRLRALGVEYRDAEGPVFTPEARADLFTYLAEEVVKHAGAEVTEFLRRTAILETLEPAVCGRLTGAARPAQIIQSLAGAGLPVMKTGWNTYRCHSLLREYFLHMLTDDELRAAHTDAGRAYTETGNYGAALGHLVAGGAVHLALDLADGYGEELFRLGRGSLLLELVRSASDEERAEHYRAYYWAAIAASRMFQSEWAADALDRVHAAAVARGDEETAHDALHSLAYMLNFRGRFAAAADVAHRLIEAIPADHVASRAAATLAHLVPDMSGSGGFKATVALVHERLEELSVPPRDSRDHEAFGRTFAAFFLARNGEFAEAYAQLNIVDTLLPECSDEIVRTFVPWTRSSIAVLSGDFDAATAAALEAEESALQIGDRQRVFECRSLRAALNIIRGVEVEPGFDLFEELRAGAASFWAATLSRLSLPRRMLASGDTAKALAVAEANLAAASSRAELWSICFCRLELAYIQMRSGNADAAREHAQRALEAATELSADLLLYGANLMVAATSQTDEEGAIGTALRIADARDYRFLLPYYPRLPELNAVLWRALGSERHERAAALLRYIGPTATEGLVGSAPKLDESAAVRAVDVLAGFGVAGRAGLADVERSPWRAAVAAAREARSALEKGNPYRLSDREVEVLQLLSQGMRTKDIAERLVLTPATVSTHLQRIMSKTGTASRAELLALAAQQPAILAR
jgi:ATP/maltotriose-dependent transcriptional regulator MalT